MFGPALTLYLKDVLPMMWIFGLLFVSGAMTFIFSLFVAQRIRKAILMKPERRVQPYPSGSWKNRVLGISGFIMLLASVANGAIFTFLPMHLEERGSPYGSVYFLVQTVVLVCCRFFGRHLIRSDGATPVVSAITLALVAGSGFLLLGVTLAPPLLMLAAVMNGIAFAVLYPTLLTFVSFRVPEAARGFLIGLFIGAADFGFALGALAMGPVADAFSYPAMFQVCAVLCVIAALFALAYRRDPLRELEQQEAAA